MGTSPIRVMIVSDLLLYREAVLAGLVGASSLQVIDHCCLKETIDRLRDIPTDAVLLDASSPSAFVLTREICIQAPGTRVIGIAVGGEPRDVLACAEAGFSGFVGSEVGFCGLIAAVEQTLNGEILCNPRIAGALFMRLAELANLKRNMVLFDPRQSSEDFQLVENIDGSADLSPRESEVAMLVGEGLTNKEIARCLSISVATVKHHVHNILDKLGAPRRSAVRGHLGAAEPCWRGTSDGAA